MWRQDSKNKRPSALDTETDKFTGPLSLDSSPFGASQSTPRKLKQNIKIPANLYRK
jgi:hypothetical protein